jgi:hypothetical protein
MTPSATMTFRAIDAAAVHVEVDRPAGHRRLFGGGGRFDRQTEHRRNGAKHDKPDAAAAQRASSVGKS